MRTPLHVEARHSAMLLGLTLLIACLGPAHAASPTLFPDLSVEDFPEEPNTVRIEVVETQGGTLNARAFHGRPGNIGFPSLLTAVVSPDPETRRDRLEIVRVDDDCSAMAMELAVAPEDVCLSMTVTEVVDGVAKFVFRSRFFNYQVQFTLAQARGDSSLWTLIPTGRKGEPQRLELRTHEDEQDQLWAEWQLYNRDTEGEIHLPISAAIGGRDVRAAGFSALQAASLASLDLFYDLADFYVDPWVVYREDQIVDEGIPSPEENDPSQCELVNVCGAEYDTCVPTPDGWYGCNTSPHLGGWGGGFDEGPGGGPSPPPPPPPPGPSAKPDWQVASYPANLPLFLGLQPVDYDDPSLGSYLDFKLTSVLAGAGTVGKAPGVAQPQVRAGGHMVAVALAHDGQQTPAQPLCGELRSDGIGAGTSIPVGDTVVYPEASPGRLYCFPHNYRRGVYVLLYALDQLSLWDEGTSGEANNNGKARGDWYYRGY